MYRMEGQSCAVAVLRGAPPILRPPTQGSARIALAIHTDHARCEATRKQKQGTLQV